MKVCRNELAKMLGISLEGLKTIEKRHKLEERLSNIGYKLISKEKVSRKAYYIVEDYNSDKQLVNNMCRYVFNTEKTNEFTEYFKERTQKSKEDVPATLDYLSDKSNVGISTICNWDLKLLGKKIISKDGFFYFKLNKESHTIQEVTKEEYKSYWKNKSRLKTYNILQNRYLNGEITFNEMMEIRDNTIALTIELKGNYIYRVKRYKLNQDNSLYVDFNKIIEKQPIGGQE